MDVKAPVVALIVYIDDAAMPNTRGIPTRHISELARWIHGHRIEISKSPDTLPFIAPVDVKAPVVALMVYIATLPYAPFP